MFALLYLLEIGAQVLARHNSEGSLSMNTTLWLSNLGSFLLGMTLAVVTLLVLGGRFSESDSGESCLIIIVCLLGTGVSAVLYAAALNIS